MELDKKILEQLLQKEFKEQIEKFFRSKRFENIVRDEIKQELLHMDMSDLTYELYQKDKELKDSITRDIANQVYDGIVASMKYSNGSDDWQSDYDY